MAIEVLIVSSYDDQSKNLHFIIPGHYTPDQAKDLVESITDTLEDEDFRDDDLDSIKWMGAFITRMAAEGFELIPGHYTESWEF